MNVIITKRKQTQKSINSNNQSVVIKQPIIIGSHPIRHIIEIMRIEMFRMTIYTKKHFEIVQGICPKGLVHILTVIKILKGIGILSYRIIQRINQEK